MSIISTQVKDNLIINGDFRIVERGSSFVSPANGTSIIDRFKYYKTGDMAHTISRDTNVPSYSLTNTQYSLKVDCTTADASMASSDVCSIAQTIEGYKIAPYIGKYLTFSFDVSATKNGIYCLYFANSGFDRCYIAEYTINSANTWERKIVTVPMNYSGGTWDYTDGIGLYVAFTLASGSSFFGTANTWNSGSCVSTSNQVNACDSTDNNFWLANVKLEPGSIATPFIPRRYEDELRLAQRYAVKLNSDGLYGVFGQGTAYSTTQGTFFCKLPVKMRGVPTAVISSGDFLLARGSSVYTVTSVSLYADGCSTDIGIVIIGVSSGLTDGMFYRLNSNNNANSYLIFTAEL